MPEKNERWKLRFINFENSYKELRKALLVKDPDYLQRAGIIQLFQFTFELAWKVLKDYLEAEERHIEINSPRTVIQTALQSGLLSENDSYEWLEAHDARNILIHTYSEQLALENEMTIRNRFFPFLNQFYTHWKQKQ
jgi:nucleotidyltransferase substrate binding protein (TIGR01987 family)